MDNPPPHNQQSAERIKQRASKHTICVVVYMLFQHLAKWQHRKVMLQNIDNTLSVLFRGFMHALSVRHAANLKEFNTGMEIVNFNRVNTQMFS